MKPEWADRTENGFSIAFGRVVAKNKTWLTRAPSGAYQPCCTTPQPPAGCAPVAQTIPTGQCCPQPTPPPANYCCPTTTGYEYCIYQIEIDTEQFLIDPATDTNYVPICSDFLDIMPYPCIISQLLFTETPNEAIDTSTIDLTLSGDFNRVIQADVILNDDPSNILDDTTGLLAAIVTDGTLSGAGTSVDPLTVIGVGAETPNAAIDTNSIDITLSGVLNRTIQADLILDSVTGDNSFVVNANGGYVPASYADTASDAESGNAGPLDISAATTYTIGGIIGVTIINPSATRNLAVLFVGGCNVQCTLQTLGVWQLKIQQRKNGGAWADFAVSQWGTYPGVMGHPLHLQAQHEDVVPAGGILTIERRVLIQTVTPSAAGSTAGQYSLDLRSLWVTK
jgi:hypothetical protein